MFSGKTTAVLSGLRRKTIANKRCLLVKHANDTRYNNRVVNHDDHEYKGEVMQVSSLSYVPFDAWSLYDVIGVDEMQFFSDPTTVITWANCGVHVIVAAIDAKSDLTHFGNVCDLIPHCEKIKKHSAVCTVCGNDAAFTKTRGKPGAIEVGGKDIYYSVCRKCYHLDELADKGEN